MYSYNVTTTTTASSGMNAAVLIIYALLAVLYIACYWRIFTKAGVAGWKSLIPFYNLFILLKLVKRPGWWLILFLIPIVNLVFLVIFSLDLAKAFGKSPAFGVLGLFFFSFVGYPMLAFGKATYNGGGNQPPLASPVAPTMPIQPQV